jgi:NAD(P) transhydrogenase subunit alpha
VGALTATGMAAATGNRLLGVIAIFLAMVNVVAGFGVTHRMLRMFDKRDEGGQK